MFPPADTTVPSGCVPLPRSSWAGMLPGGLNKLLPLSLWICLQYLGEHCVCLEFTMCECLEVVYHIIPYLYGMYIHVPYFWNKKQLIGILCNAVF